MTPKEKAIELVLKFEDYTDCADERGFAIRCALIAVDEILKICVDSLGLTDLDYWQDVKEEIDAL
jgi:hypothetical protein